MFFSAYGWKKSDVLELTPIEIQDFIDCIREEDYDRAKFDAMVHGGKLKASKPARRRLSMFASRRISTPGDLKAMAHAEAMLEEMRKGTWQTRR